MSEQKQSLAPRKVTIRTVAEDAGVSVAAVSKVLRDAYGVSENMRERVRTSIDRLGYRPSVSARGMRGSTNTIGILLIEIGNPFLSMVVEGAQRILEASRFKALLGIGHGTSIIEASLVESLIDYNMDGLIVIAPQMDGATLEELGRQIPIVAIAHHQPDARHFDTVNSDDHRGAAMATRALIEAGHEDIAFLAFAAAARQSFSVCGVREAGYRAAMEAAGLADRSRVIRVDSDGLAPDISLFNQFLEAPDRPRAVVVWSDLFAIPLLNAARMKGLAVPEDLAITGYDDTPVAALPLIDLTSVDQSPDRIGALAVECLVERINGRSEPRTELVPPRLARRGSV